MKILTEKLPPEKQGQARGTQNGTIARRFGPPPSAIPPRLAPGRWTAQRTTRHRRSRPRSDRGGCSRWRARSAWSPSAQSRDRPPLFFSQPTGLHAFAFERRAPGKVLVLGQCSTVDRRAIRRRGAAAVASVFQTAAHATEACLLIRARASRPPPPPPQRLRQTRRRAVLRSACQCTCAVRKLCISPMPVARSRTEHSPSAHT